VLNLYFYVYYADRADEADVFYLIAAV